ncbi:MAG: peptidylprolyl isomerase [Flavobacteriales bacterium]
MYTKIFSIVVFFVFIFSASAQNRTKVVIDTQIGDIELELYDETPIHRDNFIQLVESGMLNGSSFHRVIKYFMIQGGRPLLNYDSTRTLSAEILPQFYHKKGALAAARLPDHVNPEKRSSAFEFYIVHGIKVSPEELAAMEKRSKFNYTSDMIRHYSKTGGTPALDGQYTVFGEVVKGMEIVDAIANTKVNQETKKPMKDITFTARIVMP